jgi:hypothetical protein
VFPPADEIKMGLEGKGNKETTEDIIITSKFQKPQSGQMWHFPQTKILSRLEVFLFHSNQN